jgi:hypothetical protein
LRGKETNSRAGITDPTPALRTITPPWLRNYPDRYLGFSAEGIQNFLDRLTHINKCRLFFITPERIGVYIVRDYLCLYHKRIF